MTFPFPSNAMMIQMKPIRFFLIASVLIALFAFCSRENGDQVPDELYGVWETSNSRYNDCLIEFQKHFIIFQSGPDHKDTNFIRHINKKQEINRVLFEMRYENEEGTEFDFQFYYYPLQEGAILLLKNQENVKWSKRIQR